MENEQVLNYTYKKGVKQVRPANSLVQHWLFTEETEAEAILANSLAIVGAKNGISSNDLAHLFPAILRMLKNTSEWSK